MKKTRLAVTLLALTVLIVLALPAVASAGVTTPPGKMKADTVLINGKIITVDGCDSIAQAVAIRNGKIIAVGTNKQIKRYIKGSTCVINLHGRTATPGMIDSHVHFQGSRALYWLDLSVLSVHNIADVQAKIAAQAALVGPDEWILGANWAAAHLEEARPLYAADLDPVSPDNPVFLLEASYHQATVNSYTLQMLGITAATPDPPGGIIDRDADGNPTGLLKESAAWMVYGALPEFSAEQEKEGLLYLTKEANKRGLTSILYPGIGDVMWDTFHEVLDEGDLHGARGHALVGRGDGRGAPRRWPTRSRRSPTRRASRRTTCSGRRASSSSWTASRTPRRTGAGRSTGSISPR